MKTRVELDPQVIDFIRGLAPDPKKMVRLALRRLVNGQGDVRNLEGELSNYCRLRVRGYRIILRFYVEKGQRVARCIYIERRSIVYDAFADLLQRH